MYGAKVWFGIICGALLIAAASARPAAALEWDFDDYTSSSEWQLTFDSGWNGDEVKLRGYYTKYNDGSGRFYRGEVQTWQGSGAGVWASDDYGSPNHGVDNVGKDNFLLLEFDNPNYSLTAFQIGWRQTDSDIEVWVGGADLGPGFNLSDYHDECGGSCTRSDLDDLGFTKVDVYYNVVVGSWTPVNTDVTGRYVIFAGEYGTYDDDDYFKLSSIRGQEEVEVPEPGSMLILSSALAMLGVGALRRRWRRRPSA